MRKNDDGTIEFSGEDEVLINGKWVKLKDLEWRYNDLPTISAKG